MGLRRSLLASGLAAVFIAGCGELQPSMSAAQREVALTAPHATYNYKVIYSFKGGSDGASPSVEGPLAAMNGTLFGTTTEGGGCSLEGGLGCGTVFRVSTSGLESVIYAFQGKPDAQNPTSGPVTDLNGTWYGVTTSGGTYGDGAIYTINAYGQEQVVYSFQGGSSDGKFPVGQLLDLNGTLYGTTTDGGSGGFGTIFAFTTSGGEHVLHSFTSYDGASPEAGLIALDGTLYGTTGNGGKRNLGTVFSITTSGSEKVVYSFKGGKDGAGPAAPVTSIGNELYGTTSGGGGRGYLGTVFEVNVTSGKKRRLYRFKDNQIDGTTPASSLLYLKGVFYGTTLTGGRDGDGTVFSLTRSGKEQILYYFKGPPDGFNPSGGVTAISGTLYGTTTGGGPASCGNSWPFGCGTVFELTP
jgi:uncharacterized repeat protein (TIGR03803 family)